MNPAFTVKLNQQISSGLVVAGKFDGKQPSLACGTTGGKLLIHSPHESSHQSSEGQMNSIRYLNSNKQITALAAGSLISTNDPSANSNDLIFIGTPNNLQAYDIDRNADAFSVEIQDGVHTLMVGKLSGYQPLIIAGGNCSVLGFDAKGAEAMWHVAADKVSALAASEFQGNGQQVLLVGSDDSEIRVYRNEDIISEITETARVMFLKSIQGNKFAYGLANGTVGVYAGKERLWRVKTKNKATSLFSYDLDNDGVEEVFSGWNNGAFTVRRQENGEMLFKESMDAPIAGIVRSDYRMDGKEEVMICSEMGEVRGYLGTDVEFGAMFDSGVGKDNASDQKALTELQEQKLELLAELKLLEKTLKTSKASDTSVGMLPANTALSYTLEADLDANAVVLKVEVNTDVQIVNLIAVDLEGIVLVDREVIAISPKSQSKIALLPFKPAKHTQCTLRIQAHVATRSLGAQLHVFESDVVVPKFSMFKYLPDSTGVELPASKVTFSVRESIDRVVTWIQSVFIVTTKIPTHEDKLKVYFISVSKSTNSALDDNPYLQFSMTKVVESGQTSVKIRIHCTSMELAADIIQDMAKTFKITEQEAEADFPAELVQFEEVLKVVSECNDARIRLAADMADDSQRIKSLVIRAEDCRIMNDMPDMRRAYTELNSLNQQLVIGYNVRAQNHENLLAALKEVNQMIQKAANLRVGKAKARVIADCRAAVKANNLNSLFRIIKQGYDPSSGMSAAQSK